MIYLCQSIITKSKREWKRNINEWNMMLVYFWFQTIYLHLNFFYLFSITDNRNTMLYSFQNTDCFYYKWMHLLFGLIVFHNVNEMYSIMNLSLFKGEYSSGISITLFKRAPRWLENEFSKFNNRCSITVLKTPLGRMVEWNYCNWKIYWNTFSKPITLISLPPNLKKKWRLYC